MENRFAEIADELLAKKARQGDADAEEYLIRKYKKLVRGKARIYFIAGADNEDIVQEGMIGIFKAIRGYNEDKNASFHTFAEICINRQILSAIKAARRQKHSPLNDSISLSGPIAGDAEKTVGDTLLSKNHSDPEALFILKEYLVSIEDMNLFSDMELKVWNEYMKGASYGEIAQMIDKTPKSVDNAIRRAKRKLEEYLGLGK